MGVKTDLERVRRAVKVATEWALGISSRMLIDRQPNGVTDAYSLGVRTLEQAIHETLDTGDYQDADDDLESAIREFCFSHCGYSRYSSRREPGTHLHCRRCPLRDHAITRLTDAAQDAVKEKDDGNS